MTTPTEPVIGTTADITPPSAPATLPARRAVFAGFTGPQLAIGLALAAVLIWGMWVTRSLLTERDDHIVRADMSRIVGEYVQAQARSNTDPQEVQGEMRRFMAALETELQRRGANGQVVLVGEAILSKNVPDITASVATAVYNSGVKRPQNPDIDYTLQRPVGTVAKRAWSDNRKADRNQVLAHLGERYGMFYFFAQSCGACEIFAPILRSVADTNRMSVMAVSMDGGPSKDFPRYVVDSGQRARMGVPGNATPALVLFDTQTRRTVPIGFGIMSADEIMERIFVLTNTKVGSDY